jgi:hypothetical protein
MIAPFPFCAAFPNTSRVEDYRKKATLILRMNSTGQSAAVPSYNSRLAAGIRLAPQFVNRLCSRLETAESMPDGVSGLLFGTAHDDVLVVQAFRCLIDADLAAIEAGQVKLDDAVRDLVRTAEADPSLAPMDLIGWFAFRPLGGLHEADIAFHSRQFTSAFDVALIVHRGEGGYLLFEFYVPGEKGLLTEKQHRWGAWRFPYNQSVSGPVEIALRGRAKQNAVEEQTSEGAREDPVRAQRKNNFSILRPSEEPIREPAEKPKGKRRVITSGEVA